MDNTNVKEQEISLNVIASLANAYLCIYYIDLKTEQFHELNPTSLQDVYAHIGPYGNAREKFLTMSQHLVDPAFSQKILEFTELCTLSDRLQNRKTLDFQFLGIPLVGWCLGEFIAARRDETGRCTHVLWAVHSIQKQKEAEEVHQQHLNLVNTLSRDYLNVYIINLEKNLITVLKLNGYITDGLTHDRNEYPYDAVCQQYIQDRVYHEDVAMMTEVMKADNLQKQLAQAEQYVGTYRICEKGEIHYYQYKYAKIFGSDSIIAGFQNVDGMIAVEKEQQENLQNALQAAEQANAAKTEFLFNMSHDIRTPMNAILGYTELIRKNLQDPARCLDYLDKISSSGNFLLSLINNVLEVSKIESGHVAVEDTICDLEQFLQTIRAVFEKEMEQKNISFTVSTEVAHPFIMADPVKLREVYLNLISNAYKYTPAGGRISMVISEHPYHKPGCSMYQAVITDTGIGMSKDFLPRLFDKFSREQTVTDSKIQGTGLGMRIVKCYVDLMQGDLQVDSEPGRGTTFTLRIAHRIAEPKAAAQSTDNELIPAQLQGKRVLLVEDNDLNAEIAQELLQEFGLQVDWATDGIICLEKLTQAAAGYYSLILMDIQMPRLNGYDTTRRIRALSEPAKAAIPILAMTANAFEEDKQNALQAGMNDHLAKPIEIPKLLALLHKFLS